MVNDEYGHLGFDGMPPNWSAQAHVDDPRPAGQPGGTEQLASVRDVARPRAAADGTYPKRFVTLLKPELASLRAIVDTELGISHELGSLILVGFDGIGPRRHTKYEKSFGLFASVPSQRREER